jgi:hypothetical protein
MLYMNFPLEIYDVLERKYGRDDAMATAKVIETAISHLDERSREMAAQRKLEIKDELKVELRDELATKADIATLKGETKADIAKMEFALAKMDKKFTVLWLITIFTVIFLNQNALEFLVRLMGLIK